MSTLRRANVEFEQLHAHEVVQIAPIRQVVALPSQSVGLSRLQKWGYGFLIGSLAFASIQAVRCGVESGARLQGLVHQYQVVQSAQGEAVIYQSNLNDQIQRYGSPQGVEEMARERLNLVEKDEILVRLYPQAVARR